MLFAWFKIYSISAGWFEVCIGSHHIEASDFLGYDMPQKFLSKVLRVLNENTEEWLYLMGEPGAEMLHIYMENKEIHFAGYNLSVDSSELNCEDEAEERNKCEECVFDIAINIQDTVDGIVTEFSLYENGNGRMLYEKHWGEFPVEEFEKLKEYALRLEKNVGEHYGLLCNTFLIRKEEIT